MDSDSHNGWARFIAPTNAVEGHQSRPHVQTIVVLFSLLLVFISLLLINVNSYAAPPDATMFKKITRTPTATSTSTATNTPTPTPTMTATPTSMPTATATHASTPTATSTQSRTSTATTSRSTPTRSATTPTSGSTRTQATTPTASTGQLPTTTTGNSTTASSGGGSGNTFNNPLSGWLSLSAVITGLLIVLGVVSAMLVGLVVLRNRLLPTTTPNTNLPPSGAKPWQRVRTESLNGIIDNQNDLYLAATMPGTPIQTPTPVALTPMNNIFAQTITPDFSLQSNTTVTSNNHEFPSSPPQNTPTDNEFPSSPPWNTPIDNEFTTPQPWNNTPGTNSFAQESVSPLQSGGIAVQLSPPTISNQPIIQQVASDTDMAGHRKSTARPILASIRLRAMEGDNDDIS